jgi:antitoxin component YwqK of YwqJK toxin-antitoxin module
MKKLLLLLLISLAFISSTYADEVIDSWLGNFEHLDDSELDFSSDIFCDESPRAQLRNGLLYLPNTEEPYSGENICIYLKNGQYHNLGNIKDGLRDGQWTYWYENGQKAMEVNYGNNKTNGKLTFWHEDGYKLAELMFKDDVLEGKVIAWYENGQKFGEGNYNDGKEDGKQISWYENGQLKFEKNYKDGNLDGKWIKWSEDGQLTMEKNYTDLNVKKLRSSYLNLIKEKVKSNWKYYLGAEEGWSCEVNITQDKEGNIEDVLVYLCSPEDYDVDKPFENSIERAAYKSSPLPLAPDDIVFSKHIFFTFEGN